MLASTGDGREQTKAGIWSSETAFIFYYFFLFLKAFLCVDELLLFIVGYMKYVPTKNFFYSDLADTIYTMS